MFGDLPKTVENSLDLSASSFYSQTSESPFCFIGPSNLSNVACCTSATPTLHKGDKRKSNLDSDFIIPGSDEDVPPRKVFFSEDAMSNYFAQMNLQNVGLSTVSLDCIQSTSLADPQDLVQEIEFENDDSADSDPSTQEDESSALVLSEDLKKHLKSCDTDGPVEKIIRDLLIPKPELALVPYIPNPISLICRDMSTEDSISIEPPLKDDTVPSPNYESSSFGSMDTESIPWTPSFSETLPLNCDWNFPASATPWTPTPTSTSRSCFPVTSDPIASNIFSIPYSGQPYTSPTRPPVYRYQQPKRDSRFPYS